MKNGLVRIKWRTSIVREGLTDPVRGGSELHLGSFSYYPCLSVKRMPIKETTINPTNEVKAEFKVSIIILMRVTSHDSIPEQEELFRQKNTTRSKANLPQFGSASTGVKTDSSVNFTKQKQLQKIIPGSISPV